MISYTTPPLDPLIRELGPNDRPRERLRQHGIRALTDSELVALLLGSGRTGVSAVGLARQLLHNTGHDLHELARRELSDFLAIPGVGEAKAMRLLAALELGRRRENAFVVKKPQLSSSQQGFRYLRPIIGDLHHEEFHILCLNRAHRLLGSRRISVGGTTATVADAKQIFRAALSYAGVTGIILAHNHPSGQAFPSAADINLTKKLARAAEHLDLCILDHLIVAGADYYSFADDNQLR